MNRTTSLSASLIVFCTSFGSAPAATPLGSAFTYQGQLKQSGTPVNGTVTIDFSLWDDPTATNPSNQLGITQTQSVAVSNGLFTVQLNGAGEFGPNAFKTDARWLEVRVDGATLSPRQRVTAAPFALSALAAPWSGITGMPADFADGVDNVGSSFWLANGNDIYYTTGNVAIGTTTPSQRLHLTQAATPPLAIRMESGWSAAISTNFPTVAANVADGGTNWTNVNNALTQNSSGATANLIDTPTAILQLTGFNFAVPAGANIGGIGIEVGRKATGNVFDFSIKLIGGTGTSANKAIAGNWPGTYTPRVYGGYGDLWNMTWTPTQINAAGFGVQLKASTLGGAGGIIPDVDYIKVQVFYTTTSTANWTMGSDSNADWCLAPTADLTNPIVRASSIAGTLHGTNGPARMEINGADSDSLRIRNSTATPWAMRIKNDQTTGETGLFINASGQLQITNHAENASVFAVLNDNGTWSSSSDRRLKRDIEPLSNLLDRVRALRPVSYYLTDQDRTREPAKYIGLIAQEVERLFPSLVHGVEGNKSLDYATLSVAAIGAIQEQQRIIEIQKNEFAASEARMHRRLAEQQRTIEDISGKLERLEAIMSQIAARAE